MLSHADAGDVQLWDPIKALLCSDYLACARRIAAPADSRAQASSSPLTSTSPARLGGDVSNWIVWETRVSELNKGNRIYTNI